LKINWQIGNHTSITITSLAMKNNYIASRLIFPRVSPTWLG
jgi:hypothetical protein